MAFTYRITESVNANGTTREYSNDFSSSGEQKFDENIATGASDSQIACNIDVSEIAALLIISDQDVTLETNDGTTPDDTINLLAGVPYIWHEYSYHSCLLTTNVTAVFISNASGSTARVQCFALYDSTP